MKLFFRVAMVLILLHGFLQPGANAQENTQASVIGVVLDENGEGVIGASIQVRNESTGFHTGTITNDQGEYLIRQIPLGSPYSVTAT